LCALSKKRVFARSPSLLTTAVAMGRPSDQKEEKREKLWREVILVELVASVASFISEKWGN
jgi:hypothetical protein